ncbi:LTA synthase family protein [Pedobacter sp. Du54]|uniref:LTA synthase family protein n=1 Tax=Pedobacter anseongensis TaxID=3133439 RepID=UPI0030B2F2B2
MINTDKIKPKIFEAIKLLLQLMLAWLIILFLITGFELLFNGFTRTFPESILKFLAIAFWNNILFWLKIYGFIFPLFTILYFVKPKLATLVTSILLFLFSIIQFLLVNYFNTSLLPLGADLFGYSIADIKTTVGASSGLSIVPILSMILLMLIFWIGLFFFPKRIKVGLMAAFLIPLFALIAVGTNVFASVHFLSLKNEYDSNLAINKADYFLTSTLNYFWPSTSETDIYADSYIQQYEGDERSSTVFVYPNEDAYPFYHTNETPDVLSPFFKPIKSSPNVVILLIEGLGRAFTNEGAYLGNFTPFLDSLSGKSLYWKNFLSNGGRTFGALPSILGSLPFGKNGILEMGDSMPAHLSLYSVLKSNGYHSSFYYGGDARFDNMNFFLKKNLVDEIRDLNTIPSNYHKLPAKGNGFSWGYADDQIFSYYLTNTLPVANQKPEISVILTVATHDPFLINNQDKYIHAFEQRMDFLGFDETKKSAHRNFERQYSSIMYADESLRNFFKAYQKRSDYTNTIFIITGDHRMGEIPLRSKIDRFHVPLIIYSPLLKRTAQMESVSTHFDITPSILAFLKENLKIKMPSGSSWLGDGLDTSRSFRNIHRYPLIQTKTAMVDFVQGEYHLNENQLFKLNVNMDETPIEDKDRLNQLTNGFNTFKTRNDKIAKGGKLLPDSIVKKYKLH